MRDQFDSIGSGQVDGAGQDRVIGSIARAFGDIWSGQDMQDRSIRCKTIAVLVNEGIRFDKNCNYQIYLPGAVLERQRASY